MMLLALIDNTLFANAVRRANFRLLRGHVGKVMYLNSADSRDIDASSSHIYTECTERLGLLTQLIKGLAEPEGTSACVKCRAPPISGGLARRQP